MKVNLKCDCQFNEPLRLRFNFLSCTEQGRKRSVLEAFGTLDTFLSSLGRSNNVIIIAGAGLSVSCGIPDFRSAGGIYDIARTSDLGLDSPEDLFHLESFKDNPRPFFKFFSSLLFPGTHEPSRGHRFLRALEERGKLLRVYTQNIDGLESRAGVKAIVSCHGSFMSATCLRCRKKYSWCDIEGDVATQQVPLCKVNGCGEVIKPDITFFGEKVPGLVGRMLQKDRLKADLLIVMGTSLQVAPVSRILSYLPPHVPQVLINRDHVLPLAHLSDGFDLKLLGNCDDIVDYICHSLQWGLGSDGGGHNANHHPACTPIHEPPNIYHFALEGKKNHPQCSEFLVPSIPGDHVVEEVVNCDVCNVEIGGRGTMDDPLSTIYSCTECFDYDLCSTCFARGYNEHVKGKGHHFTRTDKFYQTADK